MWLKSMPFPLKILQMAEHDRGYISQTRIHLLKSGRELQGVNRLQVSRMGVAVETRQGPVFDREFMLVWANPDTKGVHRFLTQRGSVREGSGKAEDRGQTLAKLATIQPVVDASGLYLETPSQSPLLLPLHEVGGERLVVNVHDNVYQNAVDMGTEAAEWGSDFVGADVRLVRAVKGVLNRRMRQDYLQNRNNLYFQDGSPIHIVTREHVMQLRKWMFEYAERFPGKFIPEDVPAVEELIASLRPNLVVEGLDDPDNLYQIWRCQVAGIVCMHNKPCDRCTIPRVNQSTGEIGRINPIDVLLRHNLWRNIRGVEVPIMGTNLLPLNEEPLPVEVDDPFIITKLRRGSNRIQHGPSSKKQLNRTA